AAQRQLGGGRGLPGLVALGGRIGAQLDLRKALAGDLARGVEFDLADVTKALAALLCSDAILHGPTLGSAAQPGTETRQAIVPFDVIGLAGWPCQRGHGVCGELHDLPSELTAACSNALTAYRSIVAVHMSAFFRAHCQAQRSRVIERLLF